MDKLVVFGFNIQHTKVNMEEISQNSIENAYNKHKKLFSIVIIAVLIIIAFALYVYTNDIKLINDRTQNGKEVFSEEEKLKILESLSADPDTVPSIEERRNILNDISQNSPDAYKYSEEGKLQILRALQE